MLIAIVIVLLAIAAILALAARRPDAFHVERSLAIAAPPDAIAKHIVDLPCWTNWSPYEAKDPAMKKTYGPITSGLGATYAWDGNGKVGAGSMRIAHVTPSRIDVALSFLRPMKGENAAAFTLAPDPLGTRVTWAMDGRSPLPAKVVGLFMNMDHMIGRDFEVGLANLKALSER